MSERAQALVAHTGRRAGGVVVGEKNGRGWVREKDGAVVVDGGGGRNVEHEEVVDGLVLVVHLREEELHAWRLHGRGGNLRRRMKVG